MQGCNDPTLRHERVTEIVQKDSVRRRVVSATVNAFDAESANLMADLGVK